MGSPCPLIGLGREGVMDALACGVCAVVIGVLMADGSPSSPLDLRSSRSDLPPPTDIPLLRSQRSRSHQSVANGPTTPKRAKRARSHPKIQCQEIPEPRRGRLKSIVWRAALWGCRPDASLYISPTKRPSHLPAPSRVSTEAWLIRVNGITTRSDVKISFQINKKRKISFQIRNENPLLPVRHVDCCHPTSELPALHSAPAS